VSISIALAHPVVNAIGVAATGAMAGPLADVKVLDGINPIQAYASRSLTIGGTWDPDLQSFTTEQVIDVASEESGAARRSTEIVAVRCIAYAGSGDSNFAVHRASVSAILSAFAAALQSITSIDGVAAMCRISDQQWAQGADDKGALAMCMFSVSARMLP
jgi:hypothetical protein